MAADLTSQKTPAVVVFGVIATRIFIEIFLGTYAKAVYALQQNVPLNLVFTNITMFVLCLAGHGIYKICPKFLPQAFGGKWSVINWGAVKGLALPTVCLALSIMCKQTVISGSGPGYAEMIAGIAVPISAVMQYFINGIKIGKIAILSCVVAGVCFCLCFGCGAMELTMGVVAALLNVLRAVISKKSNSKHKLTPGLNLVYTCILGLPIYIICAILGHMFVYQTEWWLETRNKGKPFKPPTNLLVFNEDDKITFPFLQFDFWMQMVFAFLSNIIVFVIYDIASPLTYFIAAGLKGVVQTLCDIFRIDYLFVKALNLIPFINADAEKYKNKKELTKVAIYAFVAKVCYFLLYCLDKIIGQRKKKAAEAEAKNTIVPEAVVEPSDETTSSDVEPHVPVQTETVKA